MVARKNAMVTLARFAIGLLIAASFAGDAAADFYVVAGTAAAGDGTATRPFSELSQAEAASAAGDRIYVAATSAWGVLSSAATA